MTDVTYITKNAVIYFYFVVEFTTLVCIVFYSLVCCYCIDSGSIVEIIEYPAVHICYPVSLYILALFVYISTQLHGIPGKYVDDVKVLMLDVLDVKCSRHFSKICR